MANESKIARAWRKLFEEHDILNNIERHGLVRIKASQIKTLHEPRLMAKIDHKSQMPEIFLKNNLAILPVSRGEILVSHFDCFQSFIPDSGAVRRFVMPDIIQSIDCEAISSEAIAVNCAMATGIFRDFLEEDELHPTVSGRMKSGPFQYTIRNVWKNSDIRVSVENAQIEIDAALEGIQSLVIVEAKCDLASDFIVRQLYYPFQNLGAPYR